MATDALIEAIEATIIKLEPGDILFLRLPEEALEIPEAVESMMSGVRHALDVTGHSEDVAVLLTADAVKLEVVRTEHPCTPECCPSGCCLDGNDEPA